MVKSLRFILLFIIPILLSLDSAAVVLKPNDLPKVPYEKYKLSNGLEVILVEDHSLPLVAVNTWYHVGAAQEEAGRTGFAHLFEHMMFAGSKHVPRGLADNLLEASGGDTSNGSTTFDRTNYFETVPSHQLELDLWIHADRMGYLLDVLDQTALSNQQDVVRNERRQTHENRPYGVVEEALWHTLFPKNHPYHAEIIGSHADIQSATLEDIKSFFKRYYRPNNATLVIVGDLNKAKTKRLVKKYFDTLQRGPAITPPSVPQPIINEEKRVVVQDSVQLDRVFMSWHTPKIFAAGDAELSLAGLVLGGGKSSRLYQSLVYEKQIAQEVSAYQYSLQLGSVFIIDITARPGHTAAEIEAAIEEEVEKMRSSPPSAAELERVRNAIEASTISSLEKFGGLAETLNYFNHYTGNPLYFTEQLATFRKIKPEEIQHAVNQYLSKTTRVVIHGVPGKPVRDADLPAPVAAPSEPGSGTEALNTDEPWRNKIPPSDKLRALSIPKGHAFKLANGLTVIHNYKPGLPIVSAYLVFRSGSEANPPDKPGLASFTTDLLDEGTTSRNSLQIADEIAQLGANLSTNASPDACTIELFALKKNFAKATEIMADITLRPSFPPDEVERQRARRLADIVQLKESASLIASVASAAALYGPDHPYGYSTSGTETSTKNTSRTDIVAFWQQHFVPNNAALVVSGDIDRDELKTIAESLFGSWQPHKIPAYKTRKAHSTKARIVLVDKPDAPQTALRLVGHGPDRKSSDYAALEVLNAALGGLFTSRINLSLREDKGYTYGAHSDFLYKRMPGSFNISTGVRTDATAMAVKDIIGELRNVKTHPIAGTELQKARDSQLLSLPGSFDTGMSIAHSLAETFIYGLGLDYYTRLPTALRQVDEKTIAAMVDKYLRPEHMIMTGVGDRKKIEAQLQGLKLGPIEYRNLDGFVITSRQSVIATTKH